VENDKAIVTTVNSDNVIVVQKTMIKIKERDNDTGHNQSVVNAKGGLKVRCEHAGQSATDLIGSSADRAAGSSKKSWTNYFFLFFSCCFVHLELKIKSTCFLRRT
jgi:hypothetical protein